MPMVMIGIALPCHVQRWFSTHQMLWTYMQLTLHTWLLVPTVLVKVCRGLGFPKMFLHFNKLTGSFKWCVGMPSKLTVQLFMLNVKCWFTTESRMVYVTEAPSDWNAAITSWALYVNQWSLGWHGFGQLWYDWRICMNVLVSDVGWQQQLWIYFQLLAVFRVPWFCSVNLSRIRIS